MAIVDPALEANPDCELYRDERESGFLYTLDNGSLVIGHIKARRITFKSIISVLCGRRRRRTTVLEDSLQIAGHS